MNIILSLGIIFLAGLLAAQLLHYVKFPAVTAYLLLGIIIGPYTFNLVSHPIIESSGLISNLVLSFVAFGLGQNFSKSQFKKIGKSVLSISLLEAMGAWILVTLAFFFLFKKPFYLSLLFGSIGAATAPAATVMVIREYKAKGVLTNTLLGVVAIDDAWCLIIFSISLAIARALALHLDTNGVVLSGVVLHSLFQIIGAFLLGGFLAILLNGLSRFIKTEANLVILIVGFILLTCGVSLSLNLSVLLANMALGASLINLKKENYKFFDILHNIEPLLYLSFFVITGASLKIPLLPKIGLLGITYIIFRLLGKTGGASLGAHFSKAPKVIKKFIGFGLLPQAGVALGVAFIAKASFPEVGNLILTTIISTTIFLEIVGPFGTKFALTKAGEINK